MFSDVSRNPGPQVLHFEHTTRTYADLHIIVSSRPTISYSRNDLFKIRRVSHCSPSERIFADLRRASLLHLRGCRAGRRDFIHGIKVIASNRSKLMASSRSGARGGSEQTQPYFHSPCSPTVESPATPTTSEICPFECSLNPYEDSVIEGLHCRT